LNQQERNSYLKVTQQLHDQHEKCIATSLMVTMLKNTSVFTSYCTGKCTELKNFGIDWAAFSMLYLSTFQTTLLSQKMVACNNSFRMIFDCCQRENPQILQFYTN